MFFSRGLLLTSLLHSATLKVGAYVEVTKPLAPFKKHAPAPPLYSVFFTIIKIHVIRHPVKNYVFRALYY